MLGQGKESVSEDGHRRDPDTSALLELRAVGHYALAVSGGEEELQVRL